VSATKDSQYPSNTARLTLEHFNLSIMVMKISHLALFAILITSCTHSEEVKTLELDFESHNEIVPEIYDINFIRLEKGGNSIIGDIIKVDYFDNKYYAFDLLQSKTLFVFDSTGSFLGKTKTGKGPGEIISPWGFNFRLDSNLVMVWDQAARQILHFNPSLEFQYSFSDKKMVLKDFEKYGNGNILTYSQSMDFSSTTNDNDYYYYYLRNDKGEVLNRYFPCQNENLTHYILISPIWREQDNTFLICPFDYTIYSFKNGNIQPYMYIDFGPHGISIEQLKENNFSYDKFIEDGSPLAMDFLINTDSYLAFSFLLNHEKQFVIYSKERNEIYYSAVLFKNGILPKCILNTLKNDQFIGVLDPVDYIDFIKNNKGIINAIQKPNEMDNQYIITFRIN